MATSFARALACLASTIIAIALDPTHGYGDKEFLPRSQPPSLSVVVALMVAIALTLARVIELAGGVGHQDMIASRAIALASSLNIIVVPMTFGLCV